MVFHRPRLVSSFRPGLAASNLGELLHRQNFDTIRLDVFGLRKYWLTLNLRQLMGIDGDLTKSLLQSLRLLYGTKIFINVARKARI